jgi:hypothetical protein
MELEYHKEAEGHWSDQEEEGSEFTDSEPVMSNDFVVYCEEAESTEEELLL